MNNSALNQFIAEVSQIWGPLTSDLTKESKRLLEILAKACINESWVKTLLDKNEAESEIFRSKEHGFILQAHIEHKGDRSPPHDHGNGWVLYATVQGQVEMGIFHKIVQPDGTLKVIQKDKYIQQAGQCNVYLEGDIHDTTTHQNNTLMLRLTSCDFHQEFNEGRLIRYLSNSEKW
ncbi:hypothetical protein KO527_15575 [Pseudoalteromonas sp. C2R02]|uniref:hypothetical protein n=1 Tax=Pseudoalteromonas sp. C2R02 TaxID=2841565 RepID=UPI001C092323|nr:hypothetical protein [Pseudoalteromonas sp. C2R02]MBU2970771.1 hypothetical protein [Pseudoalteromonas sp. C2R02]